jgi:hypothetical protein
VHGDGDRLLRRRRRTRRAVGNGVARVDSVLADEVVDVSNACGRRRHVVNEGFAAACNDGARTSSTHLPVCGFSKALTTLRGYVGAFTSSERWTSKLGLSAASSRSGGPRPAEARLRRASSNEGSWDTPSRNATHSVTASSPRRRHIHPRSSQAGLLHVPMPSRRCSERLTTDWELSKRARSTGARERTLPPRGRSRAHLVR